MYKMSDTGRALLVAAGLMAVCALVAAPFFLDNHSHIGEESASKCVICAQAFSSLISNECHHIHSPQLIELGTVVVGDEAEFLFCLRNSESVRAPPAA
jgi:hypothetical protein